jgi:transposase
MRTIGSPAELERRRRLAVQRVREGYSAEEVADFLGVDASSVRRWLIAFRQGGAKGLAARPVPGRPPKLTRAQEKLVLRWLADSPTAYGFGTELWTGSRLAQLIEQEWGIRLNPRYLIDWLRVRGVTPQRPRRVPRERDERAIADWLARDWPRIKKKRAGAARTSPCSMRAGC